MNTAREGARVRSGLGSRRIVAVWMAALSCGLWAPVLRAEAGVMEQAELSAAVEYSTIAASKAWRRYKRLMKQAVVLIRQERFGAALAVGDEAVSVAGMAVGRQHAHVADAMLFVARAHAGMGNFSQAERTAKDAIAIYEQVDHPTPGRMMKAERILAMVYAGQERRADVMELDSARR